MSDTLYLLALGANLPSPLGPPGVTIHAAIGRIETEIGAVRARGRMYRSKAVPRSSQPDFLNTVVAVRSALSPESVLARLLDIEHRFGRARQIRWAARTLDLDLLAADDRVLPDPEAWSKAARQDGRDANSELVLPHPRLHQRRFVLQPLCDIAPDWRHPVLGRTAGELLSELGSEGLSDIWPVNDDFS